MPNATTLLQQLGFSEYEARAYVALLRQNPLNGYELAKISGVPRANIYAVLEKLEDRSAVMRLDTPGVVRYAPVPPDELTQRLGDRFHDTLATAQEALDALARPIDYAPVWNLRDYPVLLDHARTMVAASMGRLLIAITPPEARALATELAEAEGRGVVMTMLCMAACANECGSCRGQIYRYGVVAEERSRWVVMVADGTEMLAGEIGADEAALAIRSQQRLLVDLVSWYIYHNIALAAVVDDLGDQLTSLLTPATRAMLHVVERGASHTGALQSLVSLLNHPTER